MVYVVLGCSAGLLFGDQATSFDVIQWHVI